MISNIKQILDKELNNFLGVCCGVILDVISPQQQKYIARNNFTFMNKTLTVKRTRLTNKTRLYMFASGNYHRSP